MSTIAAIYAVSAQPSNPVFSPLTVFLPGPRFEARLLPACFVHATQHI